MCDAVEEDHEEAGEVLAGDSAACGE